MDINRIKNVAIGARASLMASANTALDRVLAADSPERVARPVEVNRIERAIADSSRDKVIEQVAYTWFNRLCALRYMDTRGYTPVGLVSPRSGEKLPAILSDARRGIYASGLDISKDKRDEIASVLNGGAAMQDPLGKAYVLLLLSACSMYEKSMDYLFGSARDLGAAIELLAPNDLLSEGSILQRICDGLDEATCSDGVEVMGWLYQFYVSERKDEFFKSKRKALAEDIAPATQLFTPDWIVRYLVENTLGRLWMLNFPDSTLIEHMDFYVKREKDDECFLEVFSPEDITFIDPACGSGHILTYAFDLLYLMYEEEGYRPADIPEMILVNNLTGVEIDDRAAEIASFCLEMKALERDSDFLTKNVDASIVVTHAFRPTKEERKLIPWFFENTKLVNMLSNLDQIGSLFVPPEGVSDYVNRARNELEANGTVESELLRRRLNDLEQTVAALNTPYSIAVTNPPYMGSGGMNPMLSAYVKEYYPTEKSDLCTCFIKRCLDYLIDTGYSALITMHSWMFLGSYEKMRDYLLSRYDIITMAHLGTKAFEAIGGEVVQTTATVFTNAASSTPGVYFRLVDFDSASDKCSALKECIYSHRNDIVYRFSNSDTSHIPGKPVVYWAGHGAIEAFRRFPKMKSVIDARVGLITGNVNRFLRRWSEVSFSSISYGCMPGKPNSKRWVPVTKGGEFRRWYGNNDYVLNWENDGWELKNDNFDGNRVRAHNFNGEQAFKQGISWSTISSQDFHCRYVPYGFMFDTAGPFCEVTASDKLWYVLALMSTSIYAQFMQYMNPTMNFPPGYLEAVPFAYSDAESNRINNLSKQSVNLVKEDWDSFEASWDFKTHPLVRTKSIKAAFELWEDECNRRFNQLKANEEELNELFADIYGMGHEVAISVPDGKVSIRLAEIGRDIRSLISYGVGCIFGRYSLDKPGLILADVSSALDDYHAVIPHPSFEPDATGIIPITELDEAVFGDDAVIQFRRWLATAYGEETLGENIAFIENALGKSLRTYFARDFYNDHLKTYQKRPIYWLFSSPKRGLQALVYLHRYTPQTVSTLLADYVRPLRDNLGAQARLLEVSGKAKDVSLAAKYDATVAELDAWEHDVVFPLAQRHVELDLDDGVRANYGKPEFKGALRKVVGLS